MRNYWVDTVWATIDTAVARAASGRPTLLLVEGESGMGKSSLCGDLVTQLTDFAVFPAEGVAGQDSVYGVLEQWGVHVPRTAHGGQIQPFVAAQLLRQMTDAATDIAPHTLLVLDDAQWGDAESLEAVTWLLRRAAGDRLLVVFASRPAPGRSRESWRRWIDTSDTVMRVSLSGLTYEQARAVITNHRNDVDEPTAERLWLHTLGNPLFLTNLLAENTISDLLASELLPAPSHYAAHVAELLQHQGHNTRRLAEAMAVLGAGRSLLRDSAAVADLADPSQAAEQLVIAGLASIEQGDGLVELRWVHGLAARSVYQQMSADRRRRLHARAAQLLASPAAVLQHRLAAADERDPRLAFDLVEAADLLHDQHSYRTAARYLSSAANLTADPQTRQRLELDAAFCMALARDGSDRADQLNNAGHDGAPIREALLAGVLACFAGRFREGVTILAAAATQPVDPHDPLPRYRLEVLLAWARTILGHDLELIASGLHRSQSLGVTDSALTSHRLLAEAHVAGRTGQWAQFEAPLSSLPQVASATPAKLSSLLVWRGQDLLARGLIGAATADLREVQHRQHDGIVDALSNGFDSLLATSYWAAGRWDLASVTFRAARDLPPELIGLLTHALSSLPWSTSGDFTEADRQLDEAADILQEQPWQEAVEVLLAAQVVRRHAGGSPAAQATLLAETRHRWPHTPLGTGFVSGLWAVHLALAHVWAAEYPLAEQQLARATSTNAPSGTVRAAAAWVSGLLAEKQGHPAQALHQLRAAISESGSEAPLYQAHAFADHARLALEAGLQPEATASRQRAEAIYHELHAKPYLTRYTTTNSAATYPNQEYILPLTEREYDVLTLIVEGYSYAQISQELYLSQSTVSYHLGNIYPKAGVRTRHELTHWVRQHPGSVSAPSR